VVIDYCTVNDYVDKAERGDGTGGKGGGKCSSTNTTNYMQRTSAVLSTNIDQLHLPDDDDDQMSEDEEGDDASNRSNQALIHHTKKKGKMG
jgi:hypothetical protein